MSDTSKATLNQFLLSLVATTISIVLTFGTAAWLDNRKKEAAKREMVMMILYDLSETLEQVETADSLIHAGFEKQLDVAANPKLIEQNPFIFVSMIPRIEYTETVERIFSSNIETINTLGNVFFAETVSDLYRLRKEYKEEICDKFINDFEKNSGYSSYSQVITIDYPNDYTYMSRLLLKKMKHNFKQCQQMMDVSNADLETYCQNRKIKESDPESESSLDTLSGELFNNIQRLKEAIEKGKNQQ